MRRVFKTKKRFNFKIIFIVLVIILSFFASNYMINNISKEYMIDGSLKHFTINIDKEKLLLKMGLNYKKNNKYVKKEIPTFNELIFDNPKVLIYNTHNKETYDGFSVQEASHALKEELAKYNIDAVVDDTDNVDVVKKNNLAYKDTYKITRNLISNNLNDNYSLFIDLHRDSVKKELTTATIDEKNYAKLLFVVGGKHESYMENYKVCDELNKYIKNNNNQISRGILVRKSSSYNQDLKDNIVLIELGSEGNTKEEVINTIGVLASALKEYINE